MRLIGLYIGSILALLVACGALFFYEQAQYHEQTFDSVALCEARGGEWVNNADLPLCMTPDDGLLELVDGSFVVYTNADPWEQNNVTPLAGRPLGKEGETVLEMTNTGEVTGVCKEEHTERYTGKIAPVVFSSWPESEKYHTAITKDVARGVNFAGAYVVSTWGCGKQKGDACVGHAIIDARTGRILLYGVIGKRAADFSLDSNRISLVTRTGDEMTWTVEGDDLVSLVLCTE